MPVPIEDYALIGDLQTAALVSRTGSIDWLCTPRFDSPACFAALLGGERAGHWQIAPATGAAVTRRRYRGENLILESEWETPDGAVRLIDYMPPRDGAPVLTRVVQGYTATAHSWPRWPDPTPSGSPPTSPSTMATVPWLRSSRCAPDNRSRSSSPIRSPTGRVPRPATRTGPGGRPNASGANGSPAAATTGPGVTRYAAR